MGFIITNYLHSSYNTTSNAYVCFSLYVPYQVVRNAADSTKYDVEATLFLFLTQTARTNGATRLDNVPISIKNINEGDLGTVVSLIYTAAKQIYIDAGYTCTDA